MRRIAKMDIFELLIVILEKFICEIIWIFFVPVAIVLHLSGVRILNVNTSAIGHLAGEVDAVLKAIEIGLIPKYHYILVRGRGGIANKALWNIWRLKLLSVENPFLSFFLRSVSRHYLVKFDVECFQQADTGDCKYYNVINEYPGSKLTNLIIPEHISQIGSKYLKRNGYASDTPFVCFHSRDGGYRPSVEFAHLHRNFKFKDFSEAISFCTKLGYICIRMGESLDLIDIHYDGLIEYAGSRDKCDELDLFFCANAKLFVGSSSGLFMLAAIFGTPCALTNFIPLTAGAFVPSDMTIYKKYADEKGNRLTFNKIFDLGLQGERIAYNFDRKGVAIIDNTPNEILDLIRDRLALSEYTMKELEVINGAYSQYRQRFNKYDYNYEMQSKIAPSFILNNLDLFLKK